MASPSFNVAMNMRKGISSFRMVAATTFRRNMSSSARTTFPSSPFPSTSFPASALLPRTLAVRKQVPITVLVRLASSQPAPSHASPSQPPINVGVEDAQSLVERGHFGKVRAKLEADPRKKISYHEYEKICASEGLTKGQAKELAQSLSNAGIVLYFGNSSNAVLRDFIYLKPAEFNKTVSRILAQLSDDTYLKDQLAIKEAEVAQLDAELKPLAEKRHELEQKAHRTANLYLWLGFGYCVIQGALVARLTWWELSWDVMEPVTYMLTFATVLIGYSYFVMTGSEYTFEGLRKTLERRKLEKLLRKNQFDEGTFRKLQQAILMRQEEVSKLLEEIHNDPVSLHLKNPSSPIVPPQTA